MPCREGFSLLFYGFGSKKALLEAFARDCLTDGGVVAFNGYMPSLNIREILLRVATLLRVSRWVSKDPLQQQVALQGLAQCCAATVPVIRSSDMHNHQSE